MNMEKWRLISFGIPKLYVKLWWPLFFIMKFTFLFLNLAKIHIFECFPKTNDPLFLVRESVLNKNNDLLLEYLKVRETRVSNLVSNLLIGLSVNLVPK